MAVARFTYVGPPSYVSDLAQALESQGLAAEYEAPLETKDLATAMAAVSVAFAVTGSIPDIVSCVQSFTSRFAGTEVRGLEGEQERTIEARLATVDRLRRERVISAEEHADQRRRILDEV